MTGQAIVNIHRVSPSGEVSLAAANVPFSTLQWNRALSTCGDFAVDLACAMPVDWPGRYLLTVSGRDEVGVVEKVEIEDGACSVSGRFAECLWDRMRFGKAGATVRGANWRQAVTAALRSWHMGDVPPIALGDGTEGASGSSYVLSGDAGDSAMETIYGCTSGNGSRPVVGYDRDSDASHLVVRLVDGLDRTRDQRERPVCVFSYELGTAASLAYSGDYSTMCSVVDAYAGRGQGDDLVAVERTVAVPGFDPETMWEQRAYEDVGSLVGQDVTPTAALVDSAGGLRAYDHLAALAMDATVVGSGYRDWWDLGDLVEVEYGEARVVSTARIEEVHEVVKPEAALSVEVTVGNKQMSRDMRMLVIGRR